MACRSTWRETPDWVQHVFEIDTRMRSERLRNSLYAIPAAVFLGFTATFPCRPCVPLRGHGAVRDTGWRGGLRAQLVRCEYFGCGWRPRRSAVHETRMRGAPREPAFVFLFFVFVMGWILEQLGNATACVDGLRHTCADDIGTVLRTLEHLALVLPVSSRRPRPLLGSAGYGRCTPARLLLPRRRTQAAHACCAGLVGGLRMRVADSGRYLGFEMGFRVADGACGGRLRRDGCGAPALSLSAARRSVWRRLSATASRCRS